MRQFLPARLLSVALLLSALAAAQAGCNRSNDGTKTGTPTAGTTADAAPEVELSAPEMTAADPMQLRYAVKYRFTKGQPNPANRYSLLVTVQGGSGSMALKTLAGNAMAAQGTIENVITDAVPGQSFKMKLFESIAAEKKSRPISNEVTGPVK